MAEQLPAGACGDRTFSTRAVSMSPRLKILKPSCFATSITLGADRPGRPGSPPASARACFRADSKHASPARARARRGRRVDQHAGDRTTAVVAILFDRCRRPGDQVLRAPSLTGQNGDDVGGQRRDHRDIETRGDLDVGVGNQALHDQRVGVCRAPPRPGRRRPPSDWGAGPSAPFRRLVEGNRVRRLDAADLARRSEPTGPPRRRQARAARSV